MSPHMYLALLVDRVGFMTNLVVVGSAVGVLTSPENQLGCHIPLVEYGWFLFFGVDDRYIPVHM
jgi:hypothetical protein